jgi:hypothetical protein
MPFLRKPAAYAEFESFDFLLADGLLPQQR